MKPVSVLVLFILVLLPACSSERPSNIPSSTGTSTNEIHPFPFPSQTLSPVNTPNVLEDCSITPGFEEKVSPNGSWIAASCNEDHIHIIKMDGTQKWDFSFDQITKEHFRITFANKFGEQQEFPPILMVQDWQRDSRHVFIVTSFEIMGLMQDGFGLYRVDVETGQVETLLSIGDTSYVFAFSPDGRYYAYAASAENSIHIVSIESGGDSAYEVPQPITSIQKPLWSPDSTQLVFVDGSILGENTTASLLLFDLNKREFVPLLINSDKRFVPVKWQSNNIILLQSWNNGLKYLLNTETKEIKEFSSPS